MVLIETNKSFPDYLKSLSKHARQDYAYIQKHNQDLTYEKIPFNTDLVRQFMALWERQLIRGKTVTWAFPIEHIENLAAKDEILLFQAKNSEVIALHFVQLRDGFVECHPPMYDKVHNHRYLAKFMWFSLIKYSMDNGLPPLDLGGGPDEWHEHIKRRSEFPNPQYKWRYIPVDVQEHPEKHPNYTIETIHEQRVLRQIN